MRRSLKSVLSKGTRNLLYRLSLATGRFSRPLALTIGAIPPQVSQAGECLDQLIGPWVEPVGTNLFRVSPLASDLGHDMLPPDEQKQIHETIAVQTLRKGKVDAIDANTIMMHAIAGESPESLFALALGVLREDLDPSILEMLAEHFLVLRLFRTDVAIYPLNFSVSAMLRIAQFRLAVTASDGNRIPDIKASLFNEISSLPEGEPRRALEARAMITLLTTMGVANYLDDWLSLLLRLKSIVGTNEFLKDFTADIAGSVDTANSNFLGPLFSIGSANLASVARLEHVINKLDELNPSDRALLLAPIDKGYSDYAVLINGPWIALRRENFDAGDAAMRYQRMAEKTRDWNVHPLSLQCSVAQAIMLDEYQNDMEGALAVLEETVTAMGNDVILSRATAQVYWRHDQHEKALNIFRSIADQVGGDDSFERAYALREAAISAAKCSEWSLSEEWFLDAQRAATRALGDNMKVMAIGLGADSAVAALGAGHAGRGLKRLAESLSALREIGPEATLRGAYCHRAIRHAVMWMKSGVEKSKISDHPIQMEPGTCSNPNPLAAIREYPLIHIDTAWYMLAEAETAAGLDEGITATLHDRLAQGPIPVRETSLRLLAMQTDIEKLNAIGFVAHFTRYVEATSYLLKEVGLHQANTDPLAPKRGQAPKLEEHPPFDPVAEQTAAQAILGYGICSALECQPDAMAELETALHGQFGGPFPGKAIFDYWKEGLASLGELDQTVLTTIKTLLEHQHVEPFDFWVAGLCFLKWTHQSNFKNYLAIRLAAWQRTGWKRIATEERFRLSMPVQTVPSIEDALTMPSDDLSFIAKLLLAASEAAGISLGPTHRNALEAMAEGTESPPNPASGANACC